MYGVGDGGLEERGGVLSDGCLATCGTGKDGTKIVPRARRGWWPMMVQARPLQPCSSEFQILPSWVKLVRKAPSRRDLAGPAPRSEPWQENWAAAAGTVWARPMNARMGEGRGGRRMQPRRMPAAGGWFEPRGAVGRDGRGSSRRHMARVVKEPKHLDSEGFDGNQCAAASMVAAMAKKDSGLSSGISRDPFLPRSPRLGGGMGGSAYAPVSAWHGASGECRGISFDANARGPKRVARRAGGAGSAPSPAGSGTPASSTPCTGSLAPPPCVGSRPVPPPSLSHTTSPPPAPAPPQERVPHLCREAGARQRASGRPAAPGAPPPDWSAGRPGAAPPRAQPSAPGAWARAWRTRARRAPSR